MIDGRLSDLLDITGDSENLEQLPSSLLTLPIPTDNSQLEAVRHSNANKSFVLHGPPGTGKSQTITNIIANALANDKKYFLSLLKGCFGCGTSPFGKNWFRLLLFRVTFK
ncbi:hypothetical protein KUH03_35255 [Sphingobacterium sp. E70]|uniref:AAA domain-containing protein n=1 Tax=Sphingobacterium sp. E70 TaxID=2853439 RepID=UPI00211C1F58|nr:AAA domain-containing protein [Sphingobacterium sp. E70]ULT24235.1 hypothetical protein KUH03_35255 [Sphingobacterium sp. E70]